MTSAGDTNPLCQFVVLHHSQIDEPHFDFLFETSPTSDLITFRLSQWPITQVQPVRSLRNHRRHYLTFEGDISGQVGRVDRIAHGFLYAVDTDSTWHLLDSSRQPFLQFAPVRIARSPEWTVTPLHQARA